MVDQGLKDSGLGVDEAKTLVVQVKALGNEASDESLQALKQERIALWYGKLSFAHPHAEQ